MATGFHGQSWFCEGMLNQLTEPVVNPHVRLNVEEEGVASADNAGEHVESAEGHEKTDVGEEDEGSLALAENTAERVEVALADAGTRALQAVRAGRDVPDEVAHPTEDLVADQSEELVGRGVLEVLHGRVSLLLLLLVVLAGGGNEDHVLLHVARVLVVTVVRELPGEVGNHEGGVSEEADDVVQPLVLGEGAVTSLVAEDPETGADETLDEAVGDPGRGSQ